MAPLDRRYLSLQFRNQIYQKDAGGFQTFFEEVMGTAFGTGFVKIRPYGKQGDGGNDGYRPAEGIYYQAYAPKNPAEKDADAARKFKDNFETLKQNWNKISEIRRYYFVFNEKYTGVAVDLEEAKAELKRGNPNVEFEVFTAKHLEETFFSLNTEQMLSLGFDIDSRNVLRVARDYIDKLEVELDRGNAVFVSKAIDSIRSVIGEQGNEDLLLDFELTEARTLQRLERVQEARQKFEALVVRYPKDATALLHLAEISLNEEDYERNDELLKRAEGIDANHWLLRLEKLVRDFRCGRTIDATGMDENDFPVNPRNRSDYYRVCSLFVEQSGDRDRARAFLERAIYYNPEKFSNYEMRLSFQLQNLLRGNDSADFRAEATRFVGELESVQERFSGWEGLGPRNKILLNIKRLQVCVAQADLRDFPQLAKETVSLLTECHFDYTIDRVLGELACFIELPQDAFSKLIDYLKGAEKAVSPYLAGAIVLQFLHKGTLLTEGRRFFEEIRNVPLVEFISDVESKNYEKALLFLQEDTVFAVNFFVSAKMFPELRKEIIRILPDDGSVQKKKLQLLLSFEEGEVDRAFEVLKASDLTKLSYFECIPFLAVAEKKEAWDFVVILLGKLLAQETDPKIVLQLKLKSFTSNLNLEKLPEVIRIGEEILGSSDELALLDDQNKEILLAQTTAAWLKRKKFPEAKLLVERYRSLLKSFEAKVSVEAEVYLENNEPEQALGAIVEAVKILKRPSPEEYGRLYYFVVQIGNQMDFPLISLDEVTDHSFVKLRGQEKWVFIGDGDELDAVKIPESRRADYLGKKLGDQVEVGSKYGSEKSSRELEIILPLNKYILWQSTHCAQQLTLERQWDVMEAIEVPSTDEGIDPQYLIARLADENRKGQEFFDSYCEQILPIALLAANEGGIANAIGRITAEGKGFIRSSTGSIQEFDVQKGIAEAIISGRPFYLDGTSALFLAETGLLPKIIKHLPSLKVPQSVISLLLEIVERVRYRPGQLGRMGFSQGRLSLSRVDPARDLEIQSNFEKSIEFLEADSQRVETISAANKADCFSEKNISPGLCDACILAQRDGVPVLTEDYLYLQMNSLETQKEPPQYFSTLSVMRVLFEQGKIRFTEYLDYFGYLSSYRVRFLPISVVDLQLAVLGGDAIRVVNTQALRKFNFALTLSEGYGVPLNRAFGLVGQFLVYLLVDDSVIPDVVEKVFSEIISAFPAPQDKKVLGKTLLVACVEVINRRAQTIILSRSIQKKVDVLSQFIRSYNPAGIILP